MAKLSMVMNNGATAGPLGHAYAAAQMYFTTAISALQHFTHSGYVLEATPDHTTEKAANIPCSSGVQHAIQYFLGRLSRPDICNRYR